MKNETEAAETSLERIIPLIASGDTGLQVALIPTLGLSAGSSVDIQEQSLQLLSALLTSNDEAVQAASIRVIGELASSPSFSREISQDDILQALKVESYYVRAALMKNIATITNNLADQDDVIQSLIETSNEISDGEVRADAIEALGELCTYEPDAIMQRLILATRDPYDNVRASAVESLTQIGENNPAVSEQVRSVLTTTLDDTYYFLRQMSSIGLIKLAKERDKDFERAVFTFFTSNDSYTYDRYVNDFIDARPQAISMFILETSKQCADIPQENIYSITQFLRDLVMENPDLLPELTKALVHCSAWDDSDDTYILSYMVEDVSEKVALQTVDAAGEELASPNALVRDRAVWALINLSVSEPLAEASVSYLSAFENEPDSAKKILYPGNRDFGQEILSAR